MTRRTLLALGISALLLASAGAAAPALAAAAACVTDGDNHPSVGFIFGQLSDPTTCEAQLVAGCAAVLVSPTVAVTSGACAYVWNDPSPFNVTAVWVNFGSGSIIDCGTSVKAASFVPHPDFEPNNELSPFNIGVILFDQPVAAAVATLPSEGEVDGYARGDLLDLVSPGLLGGGWTEGRRIVGSASFFKVGDDIFTLKKPQNVCLPGFEGAGAFQPASQHLAGLLVGSTRSRTQSSILRLDTPGVRDFLDDYVTLP